MRRHQVVWPRQPPDPLARNLVTRLLVQVQSSFTLVQVQATHLPWFRFRYRNIHLGNLTSRPLKHVVRIQLVCDCPPLQDSSKRLGNLRNGAQDVKKHRSVSSRSFTQSNPCRFFKSIDWDGVANKELKPPIVPKFGFEGDTRNFEEYSESDWINVPEASAKEEMLFRDF